MLSSEAAAELKACWGFWKPLLPHSNTASWLDSISSSHYWRRNALESVISFYASEWNPLRNCFKLSSEKLIIYMTILLTNANLCRLPPQVAMRFNVIIYLLYTASQWSALLYSKVSVHCLSTEIYTNFKLLNFNVAALVWCFFLAWRILMLLFNVTYTFKLKLV